MNRGGPHRFQIALPRLGSRAATGPAGHRGNGVDGDRIRESAPIDGPAEVCAAR